MVRIGIDVGGTFTDLVAVDDARRRHARQGRLDPRRSVARASWRGWSGWPQRWASISPLCWRQTERIVHGTTVATNALLERKGARVGLLTTEGHRDVLEMREGLKDDRYNLRMPPPEPLVPRALRLGVRERMRADGRVETPLDRGLAGGGDRGAARASDVEAVAVCYLHAYRDPRHERADGRGACARAMPGAYVSLSSEVLPQIKEYRAGLHHRRQRLCRPGAGALSGPAREPAARMPGLRARS